MGVFPAGSILAQFEISDSVLGWFWCSFAVIKSES